MSQDKNGRLKRVEKASEQQESVSSFRVYWSDEEGIPEDSIILKWDDIEEEEDEPNEKQ